MKGFKSIPQINETDVNRFFSKIAFTANPDMCWNWTSTIRDNKKPYGRFEIKGQTFSSHRLAYYLHYKVDPKELHTLHKCDNPKCCNPAHLFLGTNEDNVADKVKKGRQTFNTAWNKGKENPEIRLWKNHICKATEKDFELMKEIYLKGDVTVRDLVKQFGVCKRTIAAWLRSNGMFVPTKRTLLNEEQVLEIRNDLVKRDYTTGEKGNSAVLCEKYGISYKTLYDIIDRVTWKHI